MPRRNSERSIYKIHRPEEAQEVDELQLVTKLHGHGAFSWRTVKIMTKYPTDKSQRFVELLVDGGLAEQVDAKNQDIYRITAAGAKHVREMMKRADAAEKFLANVDDWLTDREPYPPNRSRGQTRRKADADGVIEPEDHAGSNSAAVYEDTRW